MDGAGPAAELIDVKGTLYGTTSIGGGTNCNSGIGAVPFSRSIHPERKRAVPVPGRTRRCGAVRGLIYHRGVLYGTTFFGGGSGCNFRGCGTIFKVDASGAESVVYSFKGGRDGANPSTGLIALEGALYGTTSSGGGSSDDGTVFKVTRGGKEP